MTLLPPSSEAVHAIVCLTCDVRQAGNMCGIQAVVECLAIPLVVDVLTTPISFSLLAHHFALIS